MIITLRLSTRKDGWLIDRLLKEANRSKAIRQALKLYYGGKQK
jgi:hypothetical protein